MNKEAIKRLMYLRSQLENRIDNIITEYCEVSDADT